MIDKRFSNNIIPQPLNTDKNLKQTLNNDYISNNVATSDVNGVSNTKKFYEYTNVNSELYRYKEYFNDQNKYYIPSIGELGIAFENIQTINNSINNLNSTGQHGFIKLDADDMWKTFLSSTIYDFTQNQNLETWIYDNRVGKISYASYNSSNIIIPFKLFDNNSLDSNASENYEEINNIYYQYEYPKDDSYELLSYLFYTNTDSRDYENNVNNKYYYQQYTVSLTYFNDNPEPLFSYFLYGDNTITIGTGSSQKIDRSSNNMSYVYDKNALIWDNSNNQFIYNDNIVHQNFFDIKAQNNDNSYIFPVNYYVKKESNTSKLYLNIIPYSFAMNFMGEKCISNNSFKFYIILPFEYIFNKLRQIVKKKVEEIVNEINNGLDFLLQKYGFSLSTTEFHKYDSRGRQSPEYDNITALLDEYGYSKYQLNSWEHKCFFGLSMDWAYTNITSNNIVESSGGSENYRYYIKLFFLLFTKKEINEMNIKLKYIKPKSAYNHADYYIRTYNYTFDNGNYLRDFVANKYVTALGSSVFVNEPFISSMERLMFIIGYRYRYSVGMYNGQKYHYYSDMFEYGGSATKEQQYRLYNPSFVDFSGKVQYDGSLSLRNLLYIYYEISFKDDHANDKFWESIYYYTKDALIFKVDTRNRPYIHNIKNINFTISFFNSSFTTPVCKGQYNINFTSFHNYNLMFNNSNVSGKYNNIEILKNTITTSYNTSINPEIYNSYNINYKIFDTLPLTGNMSMAVPTPTIVNISQRSSMPKTTYNSIYTSTIMNTVKNSQLVLLTESEDIYKYNRNKNVPFALYNQPTKNFVNHIIKLTDSQLISLIDNTTFSNNLSNSKDKLKNFPVNSLLLYYHQSTVPDGYSYCALRVWNHITPDGVYDDYVLINDDVLKSPTSSNPGRKRIPSIGYKNMIYYYNEQNKKIYDYLLSDYIIIINKTNVVQTLKLTDNGLNSCLSDDNQITLSLRANEIKILYPAIHNYNYDLEIDSSGTQKYNYSFKKYRQDTSTIISDNPDNIYIMLKRIIGITGNNRNKITFTGNFLANLNDENTIDKEFKKIINTSFIEKIQNNYGSASKVTPTQNNIITIEHCQNPYKGHIIIFNSSAE